MSSEIEGKGPSRPKTKKETPKRKQGRPPKKGTRIRIRPTPLSLVEELFKTGITEYGIYGIDEIVDSVVSDLWNNPEISFLVTDENASRLDNANRKYGQRSFSMYRWRAVSTSNFIENPLVNVILVSKDCWEAARKRPNPYGVKLIMLENSK